jgi:hypothetical protein
MVDNMSTRYAPEGGQQGPLRRAGATGEVIDGLLRWSRGNMRDRYGSGAAPGSVLAEAVARVRYDGLDL